MKYGNWMCPICYKQGKIINKWGNVYPYCKKHFHQVMKWSKETYNRIKEV